MKTLLSSTLDLQGALGVDDQPAGITKGQGCHRQAANVTSSTSTSQETGHTAPDRCKGLGNVVPAHGRLLQQQH